uniref:Repressed by EFG1 protein 1-like n=1 Tax=Crassostrea virginica TaxID=6565 RepID=A0A8B8E926_CRAVI|nr:repressed by EFG1 protein 1-like [Crassostrea virginica]
MVSLYLVSVLALSLCCWETTAALTSIQQEFLDAHNAKRRVVSPSAANMRELKWSDELATVAQNYANKCVYGHNPNKYEEAPSFEKVGENLYYNTTQVPPTRAVTYWDNEKYDYDYDTNTCTDVCGHYTQKWSSELATIAQNHANNCVMGHNPSASAQSTSFSTVGENYYVNSAQVSPSYAVTYWDDEKNFYNYDTNTCSAPTGKTCAHYTQKWSGELASIAQNHANKCVYAHNPSRSSQSASFAYVGENLYANTAQVSPSYAVTYWDDEKNFYNYDTNTCSAPADMTCAHYTQNVWAETEYVGCAVAYCSPLQGFDWPSAYYYVCNYGIG